MACIKSLFLLCTHKWPQVHWVGKCVRCLDHSLPFCRDNPFQPLQVEVQAKTLRLLGECDPSTYPLQKKRHTLEFLRSVAHLRPRTNTIGAVMRVRSALSAATHTFFQSYGFHLVHTPLISASDCEGAGEMFQVTIRAQAWEAPVSHPVPDQY